MRGDPSRYKHAVVMDRQLGGAIRFYLSLCLRALRGCRPDAARKSGADETRPTCCPPLYPERVRAL